MLMMPLFAAAGYRVESFDLAGQYESARAGPWNLDPPRQRYDERLFLDDLLAVLDDGDGTRARARLQLRRHPRRARAASSGPSGSRASRS